MLVVVAEVRVVLGDIVGGKDSCGRRGVSTVVCGGY